MAKKRIGQNSGSDDAPWQEASWIPNWATSLAAELVEKVAEQSESLATTLKVVGDEVIDKEVAGEQFGIVAMAIAGNVNVELTGQRESIYETRFSEMLDKAIKGI